jgi:hypothetical protein
VKQLTCSRTRCNQAWDAQVAIHLQIFFLKKAIYRFKTELTGRSLRKIVKDINQLQNVTPLVGVERKEDILPLVLS